MGLLLTNREAITQTGNGDTIMNMIANDTTYVTAGQALIAARSGASLFQVLNLMGCRAMSESDLISYHGGESSIRTKCEKIVAFWNETAADRHFGRSESITKMAETVNAMFSDRFGG